MLRSLLKDIHARGRNKEPAGNSDAHKRWLDELLVRMLQLLHNFQPDNFDPERYRNQPANALFADHHAAYLAFLLTHVEHFLPARPLMEREPSTALYDQQILL